MSRPVNLQVNQSGAWRIALTFDQDTTDMVALEATAESLVEIADAQGGTKLRIAMVDGRHTALRYWTAAKGWHDA